MNTGPDLFLCGLLTGLAVAVPVGPISLLCIRRTLVDGRLTGLASGIGAATADALYAAVASFSLVFASNQIIRYQHWLELVGGLAICLLGLHIILSRPPEARCRIDGKDVFGAYITTFFLTLANPATILFFMAAFAGLGVTSINDNELGTLLIVLGTFLGSSMWWLMLCAGTGLIIDRTTSRLHMFNRAVGMMILLIGLYAMLASLMQRALP